VCTIVLDNAWKIFFVILSIQNFHNPFGSIACTYWLLKQAGVLLKYSGNARFELQVADIPHGQEDFINGDGLFFEVQHGAYIMLGLLVNDYVVQQWCACLGVLHYIRAKVHLFTGRVLHEGELDITHLLGFEGAIESAP
jgi:hypothetical protein